MKKKIVLISKELECISLEKVSLKNAFDSHVCHTSIASSSCDKHITYSTTSIENDVCDLKKNVDYLGSTLSQCAWTIHVWNLSFERNILYIFMNTLHQHTHAHPHDFMYANLYTCTHCGRTGRLAKFCYDRLNVSNFSSKYIWVRKGANVMDPRK